MAFERLRREIEAANQPAIAQAAAEAARKKALEEERVSKQEEARVLHEQRVQQAKDFREEIKLEETLTRFREAINGSKTLLYASDRLKQLPLPRIDPADFTDIVLWDQNVSPSKEPRVNAFGDHYSVDISILSVKYLVVETTPDRTIRVHGDETFGTPRPPICVFGLTLFKGHPGARVISESDLKSPDLFEEALVRAYRQPRTSNNISWVNSTAYDD